MGFTKHSVTCFFSSCCSHWSESLHRIIVSHQQFFAKKRGIAKKIIQTIRALMISQNIDLVAGDFNGAAWRCRSRDNISTIDEVFSDCALLTPPGPTPLWGPGSIPNNWADVCGFLKHPGSQRFWKVNKHGAITKPGFNWTLLIGATRGPSKKCMSSAFP